jgi:FkbM family methyltransferase
MNPIRRFMYRALNRLLHSGKYGDIALRKGLINFLPHDIRCVIDVGAYDGSFYRFLCGERNVHKAILIEPQENYFRELKAEFGTDEEMTLEQCVLLAQAGTVQFNVNTFAATSSVLPADKKLLGSEIDISGKTVEAVAKTLDEIAGSANGTIDLLKIDVQGSELDVLKGGTKTLQRTSFVWVEVSFKPLYEGSALFHDVQQFMEAHGFVMINILPGFKSKSGELLQADCLFKKNNA